MRPSYIDTSALAKWYLNEPGSEQFEAFITTEKSAAISRLTLLEFRCLLARRRRAREIDAGIEQRVFAALERDIGEGFLLAHPLDDRHVFVALNLISRLKGHPLRTLDALHLAIALDLKAARIATADRVFAEAAVSLGFEAIRFDKSVPR